MILHSNKAILEVKLQRFTLRVLEVESFSKPWQNVCPLLLFYAFVTYYGDCKIVAAGVIPTMKTNFLPIIISLSDQGALQNFPNLHIFFKDILKKYQL